MTAFVLTYNHRKRGRPPSRRMTSDTGTPELVMKRLRGETAEPIDLYYERGFIDRKQHRVGVHFRWLFTVLYGAPGVKATDMSGICSYQPKHNDPKFIEECQNRYTTAINALGSARCAKQMLNFCIYNEREEVPILREGLDVLVKLWGIK